MSARLIENLAALAAIWCLSSLTFTLLDLLTPIKTPWAKLAMQVSGFVFVVLFFIWRELKVRP